MAKPQALRPDLVPAGCGPGGRGFESPRSPLVATEDFAVSAVPPRWPRHQWAPILGPSGVGWDRFVLRPRGPRRLSVLVVRGRPPTVALVSPSKFVGRHGARSR